uniref:Uncharacterized protein n=1 Tax=Romanomermis culicivorax TaxID=13658 RepID=A0A915JKD2_ROMCU
MYNKPATMIILLLFQLLSYIVVKSRGYNFDHCYDGFLPYGNCTEIDNDGALGLLTYRSVLVRDGYLDTGLRWGCPFGADSCPSGFNFYGWFKFRGYPKSCSDYGIVASSKLFSLRILGNGHLVAFTWTNDREWRAETMQPILLDIWYPVILRFNYSSISKTGTLSLNLQGQASAVQHNFRTPTEKSSSEKFIFGGNETKAESYGIQMDRVYVDSPVRKLSDLSNSLINAPILRAYCYGKPYFTFAKDFQCFWLDIWSPNTWKKSEEACNRLHSAWNWDLGS